VIIYLYFGGINMKRDIQIYAEKMINGDIEARNYLINHYIVIA